MASLEASGPTGSFAGMRGSVLGTVALLVIGGCSSEERDSGEEADSSPTLGSTLSASVGDDDDAPDEDDDQERLDLGDSNTSGMAECNEGEDCPDTCIEVEHVPCDEGTTDIFAAIGLGCPGDPEVTTSVQGSLQSLGVRTGFGPTDTWAPREGSAFAVVGSGFVGDLDLPTPLGEPNDDPTHCDDPISPRQPLPMLPPPLQVDNVLGDCTEDASLLGTGDCSSTIQEQFDDGGVAFDYAEVRVEARVPLGNNSISYDFAFFSTEYPWYFEDQYNDMYIGWLESESWTGNISFDEAGSPISLNAGFLDFRDDAGDLPEFEGTCMRQHAGTKWLSSTAPVTPGEDITLVLAIFDLADANLDSYVFLDNFAWGCDGTDSPETVPVG